MNVNLDSPSFFLFLFFLFYFFIFLVQPPPQLPNFHEGSERSEICVFVQWSMNRLKYEFN